MGKQINKNNSNKFKTQQDNKKKLNNKNKNIQFDKTKNINKKEHNVNKNNQSQSIKKNITSISMPNKGIMQSDQRFAKAAYDPKFLRPKKQLTKVKVDSRFTKMLTDPVFQNTTKVDKYGRKIDLNKQNNIKKVNEQMQQFYDFQDNQENVQQDLEQLQDSQNQQEGQQIDQQNQQGLSEQGIKQWMQNYDEQSSSLEDMPINQLIQQDKQGPQVWSDSQQNVIKNQKVKATKRLALCNYDWMNISSKDLMILFNSFKPPTGFIKSIKVYKSNLGKQKMQQQEIFGPQGIWNQQDQDFQEQNAKTQNKYRKSWKELLKKDQKSSMDDRKLRAYEKQRLKYFYAVIQCDSKKTADQIYKQCDGNHFQHSNLQFDLRFIPEQIQFDKDMLRQECNQMPLTGQVKNFVNRAMGHSKVQLTWQDPQLTVAAGLKKKNWGKMTEQQLNKIDWSTYLNQGEIDQEDNKRQLFLQKGQNENISDWKVQCNKKYKRNNQKQKLVISFDTGFNANKKNSQQKQIPSLKKQKKSQKQLRIRAQEQRKKKRDQLTLITDNQDQQRQKSFKVNVKDQRFGAVFNNPLFTIDPSNPKFDHRKAGNMFKQVVQRNKQKNFN